MPIRFEVNKLLMAAPPQRDRDELLDRGSGSLAEVRKSLHDIRRYNRCFGGAAFIHQQVWELVERHGLQEAAVLDLGTGDAEIPRDLLREARRRGVRMRVIGLDINARHLKIAQSEPGSPRDLHLVRADAFHLPIADSGVDIVVSSLFLHHFRPPQMRDLLREAGRVARVGGAMNDMVRGYAPLWFFRLTRPVLTASYLTRYDGQASIFRSYTLDEMRDAVREMPEVQVCPLFPYRQGLVWERPTS